MAKQKIVKRASKIEKKMENVEDIKGSSKTSNKYDLNKSVHNNNKKSGKR